MFGDFIPRSIETARDVFPRRPDPAGGRQPDNASPHPLFPYRPVCQTELAKPFLFYI